MDVIQASIPLFFALIGLELLVTRLRRRRVYRLGDSVSDLSCGILSQFAGIFIALGTVLAFAWVASHARVQLFLPVPEWIFRNPFAGRGLDLAALGSWALVFLLDDFAYYWMHRTSHVVNLLWAGHVVHHSSEEFNLTVALRQSSLHGLMSWVFYMPIALLGVPVTMWLICHALNLVYQFWVHTREIGRLGPLELVLNTPSHHRVHHGVNPEYQDRNFAGMLIIWDRMFGTFEPEVAPPVYGLTKPLRSWNPLWANVHVFGEIAAKLRAARTWGERWRAVLGHPGWVPPALGARIVPGPVSPDTFHKYDPEVPAELRRYAVAQFLAVLLASVAVLNTASTLPPATLMAATFYVLLSLGNIGGILEARAWSGPSEIARLLILGGVSGVLLAGGSGSPWMLGGALAFALLSLLWMLRLRPLLTSSDARAVIVM
ncbi:MAG TPA: sterol desaturase family protein [Gemmatimonadales bacterium]|nr:sterol desaturase family protein [Gemmatimonadales bacterium]